MSIFATADELYACIGGFLESMKSHPQTQSLLESLHLTVRFVFSEPEAAMTLIARGREQSITYGPSDLTPDVALEMTGDVAHQFWRGELNVMGAITKRQIVPTGSLSKMMMLTPLIKAAIRLYPTYYEQWLASRNRSDV